MQIGLSKQRTLDVAKVSASRAGIEPQIHPKRRARTLVADSVRCVAQIKRGGVLVGGSRYALAVLCP